MFYPELTINQVKAILLSMAENKNTSVITIEKFFHKYLVNKPHPVLGIHYPFAVRCSPNEYGPNSKPDSTVFKNIGRCSYNPCVDSIGLQRSNYEKQQVFYAALPAKANVVSAEMTALLEVGIKEAKNKSIDTAYYTLSKWKINRILNVLVLPFSKRSYKKNIDFKLINKEFDEILKRLCGDDLFMYYYFKEFLEFMSNIFCKRSKGNIYYKISSAFYNSVVKLFAQKNNKYFNYKPPSDYHLDGILYPSANTKAEGMNICLSKSVVDDKSIECEMVIMYKMKRCFKNKKNIFYFPASSEAIPDLSNKLCFKAIW